MTGDPPEARVARSLDAVDRSPSAVTIGFFDGVHRGHQTLVRRACEQAARGRLRAVAVTFDRHPMEVVSPGSAPALLMTLERRVRTLAGSGVDLVVVLPFTRQLSQLSPAAFVERVLVEAIGAHHVVVGTNFRFGHRAAGDVTALHDLGAAGGFDVEAVTLLRLDGTPISSTAVREHVADGEVEWAARALGRPHVVDGIVARGEGRGRELGVPTANVDPVDRLQIPGYGVYAGHVETPEGRVPAATSIGVRPTFGGEAVTVEPHLIDWEGELYGSRIAVEFSHRLRDEERFDTVDELVAQMGEDIERARQLLAGPAPE